MSVLNDSDINALLAAEAARPDHIPPGDPRVGRATLELTIGRIFQPETKPRKLGSMQRPRTWLALAQGQTALIETHETVSLPPDVVAIAFPPARVTTNGLLMTNPGMVDPGYDGPLRCTVINMGRKPYVLESGSRILRLILFRLAHTPTITSRLTVAPVDDEVLDRLSRDFMNIEKKAVSITKREINNSQIRGPVVLAAIAIVASITTTLATNYFEIFKSEDKIIADLKSRLSDIQAQEIIDQRTYIDKITTQHSRSHLGPESQVGKQ